MMNGIQDRLQNERAPRVLKGLFVLMTVVSVLGLLTGCVSEKSQRKAEGYYKEGLSMIGFDQQRAFVSFQRSIQEDPRHKQAHYSLGHLYARQANFEAAEREFRTVLDIDPEYSAAWVYLGQILAHTDRWDEAIQCYRDALANPLYVTPDLARFHLGKALGHQGQMDEAIKVLEDALLVSPPSVPREQLHLEIGRAYYRIGEDAKARASLSRVASLDKGGAYTEEADKLLGRLGP